MLGTKWVVRAATLAVLVSGTLAAMPPAEREERGDVELAADRADLTMKDDVWVRFTLSNRSARPIDVYLWDTPLSGEVENDLFTVTRDGERVAYLGIVAKRGAPEAEDFVRLAPGQSRSVRVELSALYDMSRPGDYDVQYRGYATHGRVREADPLESNRVSVRLTGEARPSPVSPYEPLSVTAFATPTTTYSGCSSSQISSLQQALPQARTYAAEAATKSASTATSTSPGARYTTWFGAPDSTRQTTIKSHYAAISSALSTQNYTLDCKCKKKYYAYVYPTQPYTVYLCSVFWGAPIAGTDSQGGTLIHETSHFNVVASTDDWQYGQTACRSLATSDPSKAIDNADSHEYYAENNPAQN